MQKKELPNQEFYWPLLLWKKKCQSLPKLPCSFSPSMFLSQVPQHHCDSVFYCPKSHLRQQWHQLIKIPELDYVSLKINQKFGLLQEAEGEVMYSLYLMPENLHTSVSKRWWKREQKLVALSSTPVISIKPPFLLFYHGYLLQFHTRPLLASGMRKEDPCVGDHLGFWFWCAPQLNLKREGEEWGCWHGL